MAKKKDPSKAYDPNWGGARPGTGGARPGSGRKPLYTSPSAGKIYFRLPDDKMALLEKHSQADESPGQAARRLMLERLEELEELEEQGTHSDDAAPPRS